MTQTAYRTIIAPTPVVTRVERYKKAKGLPSNSQALAAMTDEIEKKDKLLAQLRQVVQRMKNLLDQLKKTDSAEQRGVLKSLIEMFETIFVSMMTQLQLR